MSTLDTADWPLCGRDEELHAIARAVDRTGGVLLAGPAGVGKTRLAVEVLARRRHPGRLVRATASSRPIPLGALAPLLADAGGEEHGDRLVRAHATLRAQPRIALGIDDAHQLDEVSATLVHQLAAERAVPLVVTVRTGEPAPAAVTALWKDALLTRFDVAALTVDRAEALLEAVLGGPVMTIAARRLHAATAGNVLWLRQLVAGELAGGRLAYREELWTWSGATELTPALTELIDDRIGELDEQVRVVVELLALGEPLDVDILAAMTAPDDVESAIRRELVTVVGTEARLAHPLYCEAVRARVDERDARRLRARLAIALRDTAPDELLRRATLTVGSDLEPDPKLLVAASEQALQLSDLDLGIDLLERACAAGAGFDAHLMLGFSLAYVTRPEAAERALAGATALARTEPQHVRAAQARAMNLAFVLEDLDGARAVLAEAERGGSPDSEVLGARAMLDAAGNQFASAETAARRLLAMPRPAPYAAALAGWGLTMVLAFDGRTDELPAVAERARDDAAASPETAALRMNISLAEAIGAWLAGRIPDVVRGIDRLTQELSGRFATLYAPVFEGVQALAEGRAGRAARQLREYRAVHTGRAGGMTAWMESLASIAAGMAGDAPRARECAARAEECRNAAVTMIEPQIRLAGAWAAAAEGAVTSAARSAVAAAEMAAATEQWAVEVLARQTAMRLGDRTQAARLRELACRVDGSRAPLAAAHAEALAAGDADALLVVAERFEQEGMLDAAADAAAHAAGLLHQRDLTARALDAGRRATRIARECGLRTPALAIADRPSPLSRRQREIAALVGRLSNTEIAERLGVSVRTVEGHVYHACIRLGLANRADLAAHATDASSTVSR